MTPLLAVSTCALPKKSVHAIDHIARRNNWCMEFSSGFPYEADLGKKFLQARCRKLIHNYFPAPRRPFVLNLASLNDARWEQSIAHGRQGLRLAHAAGLPFYSVHSGFCFDPQPVELGKPLNHYRLQRPRAAYFRRFVQGISRLLVDADRLRIDLLIENNVVSKTNKQVPLLCAEPAESLRVFQKLRASRLGLLLDTAHLKVSARTLGFSAPQFVKALQPHIRALHHSDNDGLTDSNQPLTDNYWFLRFMKRFRTLPHVLEVENLTIRQIAAQLQLLRRSAAPIGRQIL